MIEKAQTPESTHQDQLERKRRLSAADARKSLGPRPNSKTERSRVGHDHPRHAATYEPYPFEERNMYAEQVISHASLAPGFAAEWQAESHHWGRYDRVDQDCHLYYFLEGSGDGWIDPGSVPERVAFAFRPGDLVLIPEQRPHTIRSTGSVPPRHVSVHFLLRMGEQIDVVNLLGLGGAYTLSGGSFSDATFTECARAYARRPPFWAKTVEAELWRVLLYIVRHPLMKKQSADEQNQPPYEFNSGHREELIYRLLPALEVVQARIDDPDLTVKDLADAANLHRSWLWKVFRDSLGVTPKRLILQIRIERACHLLHSTDETVEHIAAMVGYRSVEHFYHVFRDYVGMTPTEYRLEGLGFEVGTPDVLMGADQGKPWFNSLAYLEADRTDGPP